MFAARNWEYCLNGPLKTPPTLTSSPQLKALMAYNNNYNNNNNNNNNNNFFLYKKNKTLFIDLKKQTIYRFKNMKY